MHERADRPVPSTGFTVEALGPFKFYQPATGHRLTTDSVLLADFILPAPVGGPFRVIDLGTGTGAIPLLLAAKARRARITGVEIERGLVGLARRNVEENGLGDRMDIVEGDMREVCAGLAQGSYDLVVSNPPYVRKGEGRVSPYPARAAARSEQSCTMAELISTAGRLMAGCGRFAFVYPARRLAQAFSELERAGLGVARLRFVHTGRKKEARLFMAEASFGKRQINPIFLYIH